MRELFRGTFWLAGAISLIVLTTGASVDYCRHRWGPEKPPEEAPADRRLRMENELLCSQLDKAERENLALRVELDTIRRSAIWFPWPNVAPEDRIPGQNLPTAPRD